MRTPWIVLLLAFIVTACAPADDILPPSPPRALDVTNVGGQAWLSPEDFENSESLSTRWAPPWDVWGNEWYIMYTPYSQIMGRPAYMGFHIWDEGWSTTDIGNQVPLVYGQGYVLNAKTKKWTPISIEGTQSTKYPGFVAMEKESGSYEYTYYDEDGNEEVHTAYYSYYSTPTTTITPEKFSEGDNYIATFICSAMVPVNYRNYKYTYACGCLEDDLDSCGRWNIQRLTVNPAPTCGNDRCEIGEDAWSCTQDCLDGPNAPVALADEEAEGADYCQLWNIGAVACKLAVGADQARLTITNEGESDIRFDEMTVLQWNDAVECEFSSITVPAGETMAAYASCYPPITSIGTTEFGIEGFATIGESGHSFWGWARTQVANYRDSAPEDKDAVLFEFNSYTTSELLASAWIGEGETITLELDNRTLEITIQAIDINGRVLVLANGEVFGPISEEAGIGFSDWFDARIKDVIVREDVEQPANSVGYAISNTEGELFVSDFKEVGEFTEYTINGKTYTVQPIQVAGKRVSIKVTGPNLIFADALSEGESRPIDYDDLLFLDVYTVLYQGTPDPCEGETATCSGLTAVQYSCIEENEEGFENFAWSFYKGSEYECDEACSEGYCTVDGITDGLYEGATKTYVFEESTYEVTLLLVEKPSMNPYEVTAQFMINGETSSVLEVGEKETIAGILFEFDRFTHNQGWFIIREAEEVTPTMCIDQGEGIYLEGRHWWFVENDESERAVSFEGPTGEFTSFYDESGKGDIMMGGEDYPFEVDGNEICVDNRLGYAVKESLPFSLAEGDTAWVQGNTWSRQVTNLFVSDGTAKFLVNDETTDSLGEGDSDTVAGMTLRVQSVENNVATVYVAPPQSFIELEGTGMRVGGEMIEDVDVELNIDTYGAFPEFSVTLSVDPLEGPGVFLGEGQSLRNSIDEPEGLLGNIDIRVDEIGTRVGGRILGLDADFTLVVNASLAEIIGVQTAGNEKLEVLSGIAFSGENNDDEEGLYLLFEGGEPALRYTYSFGGETDVGDDIIIAGDTYHIIEAGNGHLVLVKRLEGEE